VRQAKTVGLPIQMLHDTNKIYGLQPSWKWREQYWFDSWGSYPLVLPMVLRKNGRWDKSILETN
jgi:hypothetical protein